MARLGCKCGAVMGTSDCPSPNSLDIYYASEIRRALADEPDIKLNDFLSDWCEKEGRQKEYQQRSQPVEYWYCTECHRVYEVQAIPGGRWLRIYKRSDISENVDFSGWKSIYVMLEPETDAATEENIEIRLIDYIELHDNVKYYLSPDEKFAVAIRNSTMEPIYFYTLEEQWQPASKK